MKTCASSHDAPMLPHARGELSRHVIDVLHDPQSAPPSGWLDGVADDDALSGDDFHLALYMLYELHYRGFENVGDRLEWHPSVVTAATQLEDRFESALRSTITIPRTGGDVPRILRQMIDGADGPSLSQHMENRGTPAQMCEFAMHRSAYQLKEADPHTWALPRLDGRAKAAMAAIQFDEYGSGRLDAMHSRLFARTLESLGLDSTYGNYVNVLPGATLATVNLITMFGLHRRWRGALVGHLAVFEMTSVVPMNRYATALGRLGYDAGARRFYDVHVEADAVHEEVASSDLVGGLIEDEPHLAADVLFGAAAVLLIEDRFTRHLLDAWHAGQSSLYDEPSALTRRALAGPHSI
jgi:hypothetical protein